MKSSKMTENKHQIDATIEKDMQTLSKLIQDTIHETVSLSRDVQKILKAS